MCLHYEISFFGVFHRFTNIIATKKLFRASLSFTPIKCRLKSVVSSNVKSVYQHSEHDTCAVCIVLCIVIVQFVDLKISSFVRYGGKFDKRNRPKKFRDGQETSPCFRFYKGGSYSTQSPPFEQFSKLFFLIIVTFAWLHARTKPDRPFCDLPVFWRAKIQETGFCGSAL